MENFRKIYNLGYFDVSDRDLFQGTLPFNLKNKRKSKYDAKFSSLMKLDKGLRDY